MTRIGIDFDGTVVSCRERHTTLMRVVAHQFDVAVDVTALWQHKRAGHSGLRALGALGVSAESAEILVEVWTRQVEGVPWLAFDRVLIDVPLLQRIAHAGCSLHLVTARHNAAYLRQQLMRLGLSRLFASVDVVPPDDAAASKATAIAQRRCDIYFGDTELDQRAAALAGVSFRAVSSGMRSESFLRAAGCEEVRGLVNHYLRDYEPGNCAS